MNNDCLFFKYDRCAILKVKKCNGSCVFKCTAEEFLERQEKAEKILKDKGLKAVTKKVGNETIMTTRRIDDESKNN